MLRVSLPCLSIVLKWSHVFKHENCTCGCVTNADLAHVFQPKTHSFQPNLVIEYAISPILTAMNIVLFSLVG
jgi:hypothetical protein